MSRLERYLRGQWRSFRHHMAPHRVLMRLLFGHRRNWPTLAALLRPRTVASIRRDPDSGDIVATGVRRAAGGWEPGPRRPRAYRAGR